MTDLPAAIPWYRSHVLRGILIIVVSQVVSRLQSKLHIDISVYGFSTADLVGWMMDVISAGAAYWAFNARATKAMPTITVNKTQADAINATSPPATLPIKPPLTGD